MTKFLIVNADDFGYSYGINKGIVQGHRQGIVTSTSVMVNGVAASEASRLTSLCPDLSIGLHFVAEYSEVPVIDQLQHQVNKFISITGKNPDHIDIHKSSSSSTPNEAQEIVLQYCEKASIPTRGINAKYIDSFGIKSNDSSIEQLKKSLDEAEDGYNELMTHIGISDEYLREVSSYSDSREKELASICHPSLRQHLLSSDISLISWRQLAS